MPALTFSMAEVVRFVIVLCRIGGIMIFAPLFSSRSVPYHMRVAITLVSTMALCPALPLAHIPAALDLTGIVGIVLGETLFGMVLGLAASFLFAGMQLAGQIMSFQLGFAIINLIDPQSEVEISVFSFMNYYLGLLFFMLIDGHHWFFMAVRDSFNYLPIGGVTLHGPVVEEMIRLSAQVMVFGLQVAAPVMAVTVICDVVLALVGRAAPQINILIVGMPLKTLVGFSCMSISFYFLPRLFGDSYMILFRDLFGILRKMG